MTQNPRLALIAVLSAAILPAATTFTAGCVRRTTRSAEAQTSIPKLVGRVNINTASAAELEALPGIGKVIAERIVEHRQQFGHFRRAEHLMMVRGISDRKYRELRLMISVE